MVAVIFPLQLSLAVGIDLIDRLHSAVRSGKFAMVGTGGVESFTITFWFWEAVVPFAPVYVQVMV